MDFDLFRALAAAAAASGSVAMIVVEGTTPGWQKLAEASKGAERVKVGWRDVAELVEEQAELSTELLYVGCPHASLGELERLLSALKARSRKAGAAEVWVTTSRLTYNAAKEKGVAQELERLGVRFVLDTCLVVSPLKEKLRRVTTCSGKAFFYLKSEGVEASLATLRGALAKCGGKE